MKRWLCGAAACVTLFITPVVFGAGGEMEILLKKLQQKGILTAQEADDIARETRQAAAAEKKAETEKPPAQGTAAKGSDLPEWIKNTKLKGDFRLRYETRDRDDDNRGAYGRVRYRAKLGVETAVNDKITAGFGVASGESANWRSTYQTMSGSFSKKDLWIDYAYGQYKPMKWLSLIGGKFANPIWQPSDMLMSTEITPEGGAVRLEYPIVSNINLLFMEDCLS